MQWYVSHSVSLNPCHAVKVKYKHSKKDRTDNKTNVSEYINVGTKFATKEINLNSSCP